MKKIGFYISGFIIFYIVTVIIKSFTQKTLVLWNESYIHLLIIMTITLTLLFIFDNNKKADG